MTVDLIKRLFFLPELLSDIIAPVRRRWAYKYVRRYLRSLYWILRFGYPSRKLKLIGVTGTDGKTTVANLLYHILKSASKKVSIISTVYGKIGDEVFDTGFHVTTPGPKSMQKYFSQAVVDGSEYFIVEATSHGLDQYRLLGCNFEVGILTNITHEHIDYHITFDNYLAVKGKLFQRSKTTILNLDDSSIKKIKKHVKGKVLTYGFSKEADVNLQNFPFKTQLPGEYNKYNILAAAACAKTIGIEDGVISRAIAGFDHLSGRMEGVKNDRGLKVFVDFAHTPNGLEQAIKTLRGQTKGNLISVIGAEGQRDVGKRPLLGEIAARLSDFVIVTAVDPRGSLDKINQQIVAGAKKAGVKEQVNLFVVDDRKEAINFAINRLAKRGDVVGIFGKGHEKSINYTGVEEPWSDIEAVKQALDNGRPH